jgi:hypothetical protein
LTITNNENQSISNITAPTLHSTTTSDKTWVEELEALKENLTKTMVQTIESVVDEKMEAKISVLQKEVKDNTESNKVMNDAVEAIKIEMAQTKQSMTEEMTTTRQSMEKEMSTMRKDFKSGEAKTNSKLDENSSKLDDIISMFSAMTGIKDPKLLSGKKRDLENRSHDDIKVLDGKENIMDISAFHNIPFLQHFGWRTAKSNSQNISTMDIHDSQYMMDQSFDNCNNDYQHLKERNYNKLKDN